MIVPLFLYIFDGSSYSTAQQKLEFLVEFSVSSDKKVALPAEKNALSVDKRDSNNEFDGFGWTIDTTVPGMLFD